MERTPGDLFRITNPSILKSPLPKHVVSKQQPSLSTITTHSGIRMTVASSPGSGVGTHLNPIHNQSPGVMTSPSTTHIVKPTNVTPSQTSLSNFASFVRQRQQQQQNSPSSSNTISAFTPSSKLASLVTATSTTNPQQQELDLEDPERTVRVGTEVKSSNQPTHHYPEEGNSEHQQGEQVADGDRDFTSTATSSTTTKAPVHFSEWSFGIAPNTPRVTGIAKEVSSEWIVLVGRRPDTTELWHSSIVTGRLTANQIATGSGRVYLLKEGSMDSQRMAEHGFGDAFSAKFARGFPENWQDLIIDELARISSIRAPRGLGKAPITSTHVITHPQHAQNIQAQQLVQPSTHSVQSNSTILSTTSQITTPTRDVTTLATERRKSITASSASANTPTAPSPKKKSQTPATTKESSGPNREQDIPALKESPAHTQVPISQPGALPTASPSSITPKRSRGRPPKTQPLTLKQGSDLISSPKTETNIASPTICSGVTEIHSHDIETTVTQGQMTEQAPKPATFTEKSLEREHVHREDMEFDETKLEEREPEVTKKAAPSDQAPIEHRPQPTLVSTLGASDDVIAAAATLVQASNGTFSEPEQQEENEQDRGHEQQTFEPINAELEDEKQAQLDNESEVIHAQEDIFCAPHERGQPIIEERVIDESLRHEERRNVVVLPAIDLPIQHDLDLPDILTLQSEQQHVIGSKRHLSESDSERDIREEQEEGASSRLLIKNKRRRSSTPSTNTGKRRSSTGTVQKTPIVKTFYPTQQQQLYSESSARTRSGRRVIPPQAFWENKYANRPSPLDNTNTGDVNITDQQEAQPSPSTAVKRLWGGRTSRL